MLKMLDKITTNEKLYVETRSGAEGVHWKVEAAKGMQMLEPYLSDKIRMDKEMLGAGGFSCRFFYPSSLDWKFHDNYTRKEMFDFDNSFASKKWIIMNVLGKSDILPSGYLHMKALWEFQQVVYAKIITGKLPLDYFETFVDEWNKRGGAPLTKEAAEMRQTIQDIYRKVGAAQ